MGFPFPFAAMTEVVAKSNISFREGVGTKMLYVDLWAPDVFDYGVLAGADALIN